MGGGVECCFAFVVTAGYDSAFVHDDATDGHVDAGKTCFGEGFGDPLFIVGHCVLGGGHGDSINDGAFCHFDQGDDTKCVH